MSFELAFGLKITTLILMVVSSLFLLFAILKQAGNTDGVTAISGTTDSSSDTFYGRNQGKRLEKRLKLWTIIAGSVLAVSAILFYVVELFSV